MLPSHLLLPLLLLLSALFLFLCRRRPKDDLKQPPGPPAWPVIGNLHLLGTLPHRSLQSLEKRYGPIMSLRLGQVPAVVVSSPEAAELFLKTHDVVFASRPKTQASEILSYGSKGMAFSEYGPYWRNMRKLCTLQLFSASKVDMFGPLRREELGQLVKSIEESAAAREAVDLTQKVERLVEDTMYKMIFGRNRDNRFDLKGLIHETLDLVGAFNIADFVSFLAPLDLQVTVAGYTAGQRAKQIPRGKYVAGASILTGTSITMLLLLLMRVFPFTPRYIIPVAGMMVGNSMTVTGVTMKRLRDDIQVQMNLVETALALGATPRQATHQQVKRALVIALSPVVDNAKTVGLISLPGAMTGMIMGGASPLEAIQLQIVVMNMLIGATTISSIMSTYLCWPAFFTKAYQLDPKVFSQ